MNILNQLLTQLKYKFNRYIAYILDRYFFKLIIIFLEVKMNLNNLLKKSLNKVDEEILMRLDATVPLLSKIGSHLIKVKGKRIRPSLTLAMSAQLDDFSRNPILLATAVEFIHTATLLHDDVVDQSNLRRGIKSANIIWEMKHLF